MHRFPCKHETGEVPYRSSDGSYTNPQLLMTITHSLLLRLFT